MVFSSLISVLFVTPSWVISFKISFIFSITSFSFLVEIFREFYNISIDVKLPNDLYINGKKIGGILTEARVDLGSDVLEKVAITRYLVIGIGINTSKTSFDDEIKTIATSIKNEYEIDVDRVKIIGEFCNRFEKIIEKQIND